MEPDTGQPPADMAGDRTTLQGMDHRGHRQADTPTTTEDERNKLKEELAQEGMTFIPVTQPDAYDEEFVDALKEMAISIDRMRDKRRT